MHFTCVAALWTMECLTASLSMSLEYPPPITVATGTPFLTAACITYRSLRYSPGVHKKFRNVEERRLLSISGSPSSVRRSRPSSSSWWGSTPASYKTRSGRKVSSSQGRWASTVDHPTCRWVQGPLVMFECQLCHFNLPVERYSLSSSPSSTLMSKSLCCLQSGKFFPQWTEKVNTHGSSLKMKAVPSPCWI